MRYRIFVIIILLVFLSGTSCKEKIEPGTTESSPPVLSGVTVSRATPTAIPLIYTAVGTVKAGISSKLGSKVMGVVKELYVREGDRVKRGQKLILIDQSQALSKLKSAEAALSEAKKALSAAISSKKSAEAQEKVISATYRRYLELRKRGAISKQEFEEIEAKYNQAKAQLKRALSMIEASKARVKLAEAELSSARIMLSDTVIRAPHDGIITAKLVDKGDLARPGMHLLTLETTKGFCVDIIVPESHIEHIYRGKKVKVEVPALRREFDGNVCTIVPSADPKSRSFIVKITLPVKEIVRSGMFARVKIPIGRKDSIIIPGSSIIKRGQLTGIYYVDSRNTVRFRLIRIGKKQNGGYEVISGLKMGDRFILNPPPGIKDGMLIRKSG